MKSKSKIEKSGLSRRKFMSFTSAGAVASTLVSPVLGQVETNDAKPSSVSPPSNSLLAEEQGTPEGYSSKEAELYFVNNPGSDFMVDVIKSLDIDYIAINSGSSFRGLHESLVNYGNNAKPEILTCLHEEQAVAMAHGYAKAAGKPMAVMCHGTVGIQHAAMALYNAWADRVPVVVIAGNHSESTSRLHWVDWVHSAQDAAGPVRDFTKWDDNPHSLQSFADSFVRAYKYATTPPMAPTVIITDAKLQEDGITGKPPRVPNYAASARPVGDSGAMREAAKLLVAAENPMIIADRYASDQAGVDLLVELAELLQAPVIDKGGRMNFPNDHYLYHTFRGRALVRQSDVILALEVQDIWGVINGFVSQQKYSEVRNAKTDAKVISIGTGDLLVKPNYQDAQRYYSSDLSILGDGQASLPLLIDSVRQEISAKRKPTIASREKPLRKSYEKVRAEAREKATYGWNESPVSTARLSMEIWQHIKNRDWALVSFSAFTSFWPQRLWDMNKHYHLNGHAGGAGIGYGLPAAVGAALAHKEKGRISINIQPDGDLMYVPGMLWTAAHHKIPLLSIMHNNQSYHMETMHLQRMASRRQRGIDGSAEIGNVFTDPAIDYAQMAKSMGVWSVGPITDPDDLGPAIAEALNVIEQGKPALIDVVCQPR